MSKWDNVLTWEEWEETYKPIPSSRDVFGNGMFDYIDDDLKDIKQYPENQIWTAIDGEGVYIDIINGVHWANRLGYYVTEIPWTRDLYVTNSPD